MSRMLKPEHLLLSKNQSSEGRKAVRIKLRKKKAAGGSLPILRGETTTAASTPIFAIQCSAGKKLEEIYLRLCVH